MQCRNVDPSNTSTRLSYQHGLKVEQPGIISELQSFVICIWCSCGGKNSRQRCPSWL